MASSHLQTSLGGTLPSCTASEQDLSTKDEAQHLERLECAGTSETFIGSDEIASLSKEHRQYLLDKHGSLALDPVPSFNNADPYNCPSWKKTINLCLVAFHACMGTFTAASIIPAYESIADDLDISLQRATYLTSLQIAILGGAPLFWRPLSDRYGRRPIFLLSLVCSLLGNVGCAASHSYASTAACRAIVAVFISPAGAIGSAVVAETFFKKDRARCMGVWTLMVTLGVPTAPFVFGFVAYNVGYRWIYWILAMINGVQFALYLFLGPETRYIRNGAQHHDSTFTQEYLHFKRIDNTPLTLRDFVRPLGLAKHACVTIPTIAYTMVFLFGSVSISVEIPELFAQKFGFNAEQLGLQFLGVIIGSVLGEQIGGGLSDSWMKRRAKNLDRPPAPEFRLWLSYIGFLLTIVGTIVFLVQTENAPDGHWNVSPIIGAAIAGGGNQIVTTVLVTYAVDCYPDEASSVGVFITFVRQLWGFVGPFWFPSMFNGIGLSASAAVATALIFGVSVLPTVLLQWKGRTWRA